MRNVNLANWHEQKKWRGGKVKSANLRNLIFLGFFAVFWNAISWAVIIKTGQLRQMAGSDRLILLFPAIGVLVIASLIYQLIRQFRFGTSVFEMNPKPGVIGGTVGGVIHIPKHIEPKDGFELTLSSIHRYSSGSGDNSSTKEDILWQDRKIIERGQLISDTTCSDIPVLFGVPYESQKTTVASGYGYVWRLDIKAALPGVDYAAQFEIPVLQTATSDPNFKHESVVSSGYEKRVSDDERLSGCRVIVEPSETGGLRVACPLGRNIGGGIVSLTIGLSAAAFVVMAFSGAGLVFGGLIGFIALAGGLDLLFWKSDIDISGNEIHIHNGFFGLKSRRLNTSEVVQIESSQSCSTNNSVWFAVKLRPAVGKPITLAKGVPDERTAKLLCKRISHALGL